MVESPRIREPICEELYLLKHLLTSVVARFETIEAPLRVSSSFSFLRMGVKKG